MTHYFKNPENLAHNRKEITFRFLGIYVTLTVDDGVFSKSKPDDGSLYLIEEVLKHKPQGSVLDLGSGVGLMSILLKQHAPDCSVKGFEVNPRALQCAIESTQKLKLEIEFEEKDVTKGFEGTYDWILTNPPIRAGKAVVYTFFKEASKHLAHHGKFVVVIRRQQGAASAFKELETLFNDVERLDLRKGYEILMAQNPLT